MTRGIVLIATHDPGGALAIAPVLKAIRQKTPVALICSEFARTRLDTQGLESTVLPQNLSAEQAAQFLNKHQPSALLTGTSWNSNSEQMLRNQAARAGIRSVVVIDYWRNYSARWAGAEYPLQKLPDIVCVADDFMRKEMLEEGFPANKVFSTGQPHLEKLSAIPADLPFGPPKEFLFLSEPCLHLEAGHAHPFELVTRAVRKTCPPSSRLHFKAHPKEELPEDLLELVQNLSDNHLEVKILPQTTIFPAGLRQFDFVIGYQTMGLFEAAALGKRVIAMPLPNPNSSLLGALADFGISTSQLCDDFLAETIAKLAITTPPMIGQKYSGATAAIVNQIL